VLGRERHHRTRLEVDFAVSEYKKSKGTWEGGCTARERGIARDLSKRTNELDEPLSPLKDGGGDPGHRNETTVGQVSIEFLLPWTRHARGGA